MHRLTVIGAGVWGTALAVQFAKRGCRVNLWGRNAALMDKMAAQRVNAAYLPDIQFPESLHCATDFDAAVAASDIVLLVTPTPTIRSLSERLASRIDSQHRGIAWACKGMEASSGAWMHEVVGEALAKAAARELPLAAISGPSFARELAMGLPTAVVIASQQLAFADSLAELLHGDQLRVYTSDDMIGVECGGALKNIIAIAAGISEGLCLGENAKAALIARGLNEVIRFTQTLGGRSETIMGLAGVGDIVLSCASDQSRNHRLGKLLVQYQSAREACAQDTGIVEGLETATAVLKVARRHRLEMPICEQIALILEDQIGALEAVEQLLKRQAPFRA